MTLHLDVDLVGPFFTDDLERDVERGLQQSLDDIGQRGLALLRMTMHASFRHPTGTYERRVRVDRAGNDRVINDRRDVKGPWLEGISTRNHTTRFKGYALYRRTTQFLDAQAGPIAERDIHEAIRRYL